MTLRDLLDPGGPTDPHGAEMTPRRALRAVGHYLDRERSVPEGPAEVVLTWNDCSELRHADDRLVAVVYFDGRYDMFSDEPGSRGHAEDETAARIEVEKLLPPHVRVTNPATPSTDSLTGSDDEVTRREWPGPWKRESDGDWYREWSPTWRAVAINGAIWPRRGGLGPLEYSDIGTPDGRRAADAILATICDGPDPHAGSGYAVDGEATEPGGE